MEASLMSERLEKETVIRYAQPIVYKFILKYAPDIPHEHKEEIEQTAYMRLLESFDSIDPSLGWKSFTYNHCRGAVLDYLKFGVGFAENKWSIRKDEAQDARHRNKIKERVFLDTADGEDIDMDHILGQNGIFNSLSEPEISINWALVSRMASVDQAIHAFAKRIRGFEIKEIARCFGISKSQAGQLIAIFIDRFDDPQLCSDVWFLQTCYAFGLCKHLGLKEVDQSTICGFRVGWNIPPVDLDSDEAVHLDDGLQLSLFDVG